MANHRQGNRIQTTVNISSDAVEALDALSKASTVSRSRLVDLALRRFIRWADPVRPQDLKLIADYEVNEPTAGFLRRRTTTMPPPPVNGDEDHEADTEEDYEAEETPDPVIIPKAPKPPVEVNVRRRRGERPR